MKFCKLGTIIFVLVSVLLFCSAPFLPGVASGGAAVETAKMFPTVLEQVNGQEVLVPNWDRIALGNLAPNSEAWSFDVPPEAGHDLGYSKRSCAKGQPLDECLQLGDFSEAFHPEMFNLDTIGAITNIQPGSVVLSAFPLALKQSLSHLVKIVPYLGDFNLNEVAPISELVNFKLPGSNLGGVAISQVLSEDPQLAAATLSELPEEMLGSYSLDSIPNLSGVPLHEMSKWSTAFLKDVPGLNAVTFAQMPNPIRVLQGFVGKADMFFGTKESNRNRTITGGYAVGFNYPCDTECAYVELDGLGFFGSYESNPLHGAQWIAGNQRVATSGSGFLANAIGGGTEPTGRHPFGPGFKVVMRIPDETRDVAYADLYFKACAAFLGCTGYVLGPVGPFITYSVGSPVIVGLLENVTPPMNSVTENTSSGEGASSGLGAAHSTHFTPVATRQLSFSKKAPSADIYQSINLAAYADAIAQLENEGDSSSIGPYVCDGGTCGRWLGRRYHIMSYNPRVVQIIAAKPGGQELLARLKSGGTVTPQELFQFFSEEEQEKVFREETARKIDLVSQQVDPKTGGVFAGDRTIERLAQMDCGGVTSKIDSDVVASCGRNVLNKYKAL